MVQVETHVMTGELSAARIQALIEYSAAKVDPCYNWRRRELSLVQVEGRVATDGRPVALELAFQAVGSV